MRIYFAELELIDYTRFYMGNLPPLSHDVGQMSEELMKGGAIHIHVRIIFCLYSLKKGRYLNTFRLLHTKAQVSV